MKTFATILAVLTVIGTALFIFSVKDTMDKSEVSGHAHETNQVIEGNW